MAKKKEENPLFVGISNKDVLQRTILESSKGILEALKEHETFKSVRDEKMKLVDKFKDDVKEISKLMGVLRGYLPNVKEAGTEKVDIEKIKEETPKKVKVEKPKVKTELEKLEDELGDIESKLNSLG